MACCRGQNIANEICSRLGKKNEPHQTCPLQNIPSSSLRWSARASHSDSGKKRDIAYGRVRISMLRNEDE